MKKFLFSLLILFSTSFAFCKTAEELNSIVTTFLSKGTYILEKQAFFSQSNTIVKSYIPKSAIVNIAVDIRKNRLDVYKINGSSAYYSDVELDENNNLIVSDSLVY